MSISSRLCLALGMLFATTIAFASNAVDKPFDISTPESFHAQVALVQAGMDPGGAYGFLSRQERAGVEQKIAAMDALLQRYGTIEAMDGAARVDLFNAQESANRILTQGRTGNIRCQWTPPTGSHVARTHCWPITGA